MATSAAKTRLARDQLRPEGFIAPKRAADHATAGTQPMRLLQALNEELDRRDKEEEGCT